MNCKLRLRDKLLEVIRWTRIPSCYRVTLQHRCFMEGTGNHSSYPLIHSGVVCKRSQLLPPQATLGHKTRHSSNDEWNSRTVLPCHKEHLYWGCTVELSAVGCTNLRKQTSKLGIILIKLVSRKQDRNIE